ncbi:MAG: type I-MYXAN CRISPR-associated protein Cas6/Cmx6 [Gammaproteobacteria bacterium]|nr:type I-MYXAN CRISPR-associated protein Cas6/Cmx6 [Gammaproteobacteria bacterium]
MGRGGGAVSPGYWQEERDDAPPAVADDVIDLVFTVRGRTLPADHAWALSEAIEALLPWFPDEPRAGLHLVHAAASGNGWQSPEDDDEGVLYLARRTRLVLRIPRERIDDARVLEGVTLDVAGHSLEVGTAREHLLSPLTTLYARHVIAPEGDEEAFLEDAARELAGLGIECKRMICGRTRHFRGPRGRVFTRSLMLDGLDFDASQQLQRSGLGPGRHHGFGLFVPHKAVK